MRILGDTRVEANETIKLISSAARPGWTPGKLTLTITDNDPPAKPAGFSATKGDTSVYLVWTNPGDGGSGGIWWLTGHRLKGTDTWQTVSANISQVLGNARRAFPPPNQPSPSARLLRLPLKGSDSLVRLDFFDSSSRMVGRGSTGNARR